jgi:hypothetical protein
VRLKPENAAILYKLVRAEKMANTRVVLTGAIPGGPGVVKNVLGTDPYAADEALAAWTPPAPVVVEEKHKAAKAEPARHPVRSRTRQRSQAPRYYYQERRQPNSFADIFFGRRE